MTELYKYRAFLRGRVIHPTSGGKNWQNGSWSATMPDDSFPICNDARRSMSRAAGLAGRGGIQIELGDYLKNRQRRRRNRLRRLPFNVLGPS